MRLPSATNVLAALNRGPVSMLRAPFSQWRQLWSNFPEPGTLVPPRVEAAWNRVHDNRPIRFGMIMATGTAVLTSTTMVLSQPLTMASDIGEGTPAPTQLSALEQRSYVYASDGSLMAALHGEVNRQPLPLSEIPPHVVDAVLAVEDAGFWTHDGVDAYGMLRALQANVGTGEVAQGGSTITQQLVKLSLVGNDKTMDRKVQEIVLAQRLERQLTKTDILGRYLSTVYFGNHAYGIQAAAETYYGVGAKDLTMGQAALLAGLIRNPSSTNPIRNPERARKRRTIALERMADEGLVTPEQAAAIELEPIPAQVHQVVPLPNDYFAEEVKQQLLEDPAYGLGATQAERERALFSGGLKIHTTFDPRAQQLAIAARDDQLGPGGLFDIGPAVHPDTRQPLVDPETGQPMVDPATGKPLIARGTAAIVSVEPATGAVRAMVGGPGFTEYKFNLATQNPRQGGSSFKTFVLTSLMEQGFSPNDIVDGTGPCTFPMPGAAPYTAENFDNSAGSVDTITAQTTRSSNCAYLRLGQIAGLANVVDVAHRMGVTAPLDPSILSTPLGVQEITPLEMAGAYATLANDGVYNMPYYVERVEDPAGRVIFQHTPAPRPGVSAQAARLVSSVLQQNVQGGTGTSARLGAQPAAGKTGTAQDSADAWFIGYTPHIATAVWVGGMGGRLPIRLGGSGITGGSYPARIWGQYMKPYHDGLPRIGFPGPAPVGGGRSLDGSSATTLPGGVDVVESEADYSPPPTEGAPPPTEGAPPIELPPDTPPPPPPPPPPTGAPPPPPPPTEAPTTWPTVPPMTYPPPPPPTYPPPPPTDWPEPPTPPPPPAYEPEPAPTEEVPAGE